MDVEQWARDKDTLSQSPENYRTPRIDDDPSQDPPVAEDSEQIYEVLSEFIFDKDISPLIEVDTCSPQSKNVLVVNTAHDKDLDTKKHSNETRDHEKYKPVLLKNQRITINSEEGMQEFYDKIDTIGDQLSIIFSDPIKRDLKKMPVKKSKYLVVPEKDSYLSIGNDLQNFRVSDILQYKVEVKVINGRLAEVKVPSLKTFSNLTEDMETPKQSEEVPYCGLEELNKLSPDTSQPGSIEESKYNTPTRDSDKHIYEAVLHKQNSDPSCLEGEAREDEGVELNSDSCEYYSRNETYSDRCMDTETVEYVVMDGATALLS